ncbi:rhodanese-like domain-containing protein [Photobacterium sanctipauli]|uniref:Rhodanese-like domain-containing protein n=2 Tax=Photobacterium sanctipauli TaxID=1342794 RepID=A0A2T3NIT2_9GAMM|nr:rhodanese-like domain-containing protein [Photobacterium sanctipauli]PSW15161.1 rhodanese-like domain-containing protein [Photobacterium sanctipauli]
MLQCRRPLVILALILLSGLSHAEVVTPEQFWQHHQASQHGKPLIIDVRTNDEFLAGHLPNAINIPYDQIERLTNIAEDKSQAIFLYCRSGRRSAIAEQAVLKQGYSNVYNGESYEALLEALPAKK